MEHGDWVVVLTCFNHLEKYEFVNGKDYNIYEMENKKKFLFIWVLTTKRDWFKGALKRKYLVLTILLIRGVLHFFLEPSLSVL